MHLIKTREFFLRNYTNAEKVTVLATRPIVKFQCAVWCTFNKGFCSPDSSHVCKRIKNAITQTHKFRKEFGWQRELLRKIPIESRVQFYLAFNWQQHSPHLIGILCIHHTFEKDNKYKYTNTSISWWIYTTLFTVQNYKAPPFHAKSPFSAFNDVWSLNICKRGKTLVILFFISLFVKMWLSPVLLAHLHGQFWVNLQVGVLRSSHLKQQFQFSYKKLHFLWNFESLQSMQCNIFFFGKF